MGKKGSGKRKGSTFEREVCDLLSRWWTNGRRNDIFWRSASSGGRATSRRKHGQSRTAGSYGDITATDPKGEEFLDVFCVELKRGYKDVTPFDIFDRLPTSKPTEWEKWYSQALESYKYSGSATWMLITRRDRRRAVVYMPSRILNQLPKSAILGSVTFPVSESVYQKQIYREYVSGVLLEQFLKEVTPDAVKRLGKVL